MVVHLSRISDKKIVIRFFSSSKRWPWNGTKMNKVFRHFSYMGNENPIFLFLQWAGGNGNVLKEIIEDKGYIIDIGK